MYGGAAVSWQARKQHCVSLSTAEAEYIALCEAAKEMISIKGLLKEITGNTDSIDLYSDSQSAKKLVYFAGVGRRSKHINIRYHYARELAEAKEIDVKYCETNLMPADFLTKNLCSPIFDFGTKYIGIDSVGVLKKV